VFGTDRLGVAHVAAVVGGALVAYGLTLPWVGETQVQVYVLGMASGLERQWATRLALVVGVGLVATLFSVASGGGRGIVRALVGGMGLATLLVAGLTGPLASEWPAAIGVFVTLAGGAVLLAGALVDWGVSAWQDGTESAGG
jgi:hypothetical protein